MPCATWPIAATRNMRAGFRSSGKLSWCGRLAGLAGSNIEYVLNTVRHLEEAGIHDVELAALAKRLTARPGGAS